MNRDTKATILVISIALVVLLGLVAAVAIFYAEENSRGKRAWEKCKADLAAKGETLNWKDYIPPPVPDDQNFFKAPKMTEWFVKSKSANSTNELVKRLAYPDTNTAVIAELVVTVPSTNASLALGNSNLVLRYSSFGKAIFLPPATVETNMSSPDFVVPLIEMQDVPLTSVIENLARLAHINYLLDPKIGYNQPDLNGQIKPEPTVSVRWENITAREALLALLNQYDLQLVEDLKSNVARITMINPGSPQFYLSPNVREKIVDLFRNVIGTNALGSQGFALLTKSLAEIKPARITLQSERTPDAKAIIALFTQCFPNDAATLGSPKIHVEPNGPNSFRVVLDADSAADYLAWSDQFESEFDTIRKALKRPYTRMDGDYSDPLDMPIPNFVNVRVIAQTLAQRAQCYLLFGRPEKALQELTLLNDSRRMLEAAPTGKPVTLVAAMIDVAVTGLYANTIADGLHLRAWQEPQLHVLQQQLEGINLLPFVVEGFRVERASNCHIIENLLRRDDSIRQKIESGRMPFMPHGWFYQNMVWIAKLDQVPVEFIDCTNQIISPKGLDDASRTASKFGAHPGPYTLLAAISVPDCSRASNTLGRNQTLANEAQTACALERYRLAHGEYPETLGALVPQFIEKLPHDIIGGQPLHYHHTADGKFLLYSVGWNETDDGGQVVLKEDGSVDREKGDWIWKN